MSVPPDRMMDLIKSQRGSDTALPASSSAPPADTGTLSGVETPPMASPMTTPEPKMGNKEGAMVNLSMAMDLIEQALPSLGSESDEGQKALAAIRSLTSVLGPKKNKTKELQQSEIIQMLQNLPQAGGATPEGRAMSQAPAVPNLPPMPGAGMPPGMPPAGGATPPPM